MQATTRDQHCYKAVKIMNRSEAKIATVLMVLLSAAAWASPMSPATRKVIPAGAQQIISVDYLTLKKIDTAMALKAQVLPDHLKEFESTLKSIGIDPDSDLDSLTFASFNNGQLGLQMVGMASGSVSPNVVLRKLVLQKLQKIKAVKYRDSDLYPIP